MIIFDDVNFGYENEPVLSNFSLHFDENKIHCIMGPSGCGKTTLLNLIAKLLKPNSGTIKCNTDKVSYVFQDDRLIPQKTVLGNLDFALSNVYNNKKERLRVCYKYLDLVGLSETYNKYPHELSGGMKQRLSIARAFSYPAKILLMDEPFKALDSVLRNEIIESFLTLWNIDKRTVLFVTHDPEEVASLADCVYIFQSNPLQVKTKIEVDTPRNDNASSLAIKIYNNLIEK
jgi:NitT/TauT family transport system ATP-binding protein